MTSLMQCCGAGHSGITTWPGNDSTRLTSASFPRLRWRYGDAFCEPAADHRPAAIRSESAQPAITTTVAAVTPEPQQRIQLPTSTDSDGWLLVFDAFTGSRHQLVIDPAIVSRHSSPVAFTSSQT